MNSAVEKLTRQPVQGILKRRDEIKQGTFWGVTDADSWLRNGKLLLFDENWRSKMVFNAVIQTAVKQK